MKINTIQGDVKVNLFQPGPNQIGFVKYADKQIDFGPGNGIIDYQITEKSENPRSVMNMPVKYTIRI